MPHDSTPGRPLPPRRPSRAFYFAVAIIVGLVGVFIAYERLGTEANIDEIQYFQNLRQGFLAVGMTDSQPGAILLSALEKSDIKLDATTRNNPLTGISTTLALQTPAGRWQWRLRSPLVIIVDEDGIPRAETTSFSFDRFQDIRQAVDCSQANPHEHKSCGTSFEDLADLSSRWPIDEQPDILNRFLKRYAGDPPHKKSGKLLTRSRLDLSGAPGLVTGHFKAISEPAPENAPITPE